MLFRSRARGHLAHTVDSYHYLDTGVNALVVRTSNGNIAANFLGDAGSHDPSEGNCVFHKDCKVFGNLLLGPSNVNVLATLERHQRFIY